MRISKCSEYNKHGPSSLNGAVCVVAYNKGIPHLSVHIYVCGVCTCVETGRQLKGPAFPCSSQGLFNVHCCVHQTSWLGASGDCSFHFTSVHSSAGFIDGAASPAFPECWGCKIPLLCLCNNTRASSPRPSSISY